jgi:hypothetical protein
MELELPLLACPSVAGTILGAVELTCCVLADRSFNCVQVLIRVVKYASTMHRHARLAKLEQTDQGLCQHAKAYVAAHLRSDCGSTCPF